MKLITIAVLFFAAYQMFKPKKIAPKNETQEQRSDVVDIDYEEVD